MRPSITYFVVRFLALCLLAGSGSFAVAQYYWHALPNAPISWRLDDMYWLNPQEGWAINPYYSYLTPKQYARVLHTTDAGQTWDMLLDSSEIFIRSVGFADSQTGWFGNLGESTPDTNFMYQTTDAGQNWTPVTQVAGPKPEGICGITVVTDSLTFAYGRYSGPSVIMRTQDKGQTWTSQSLDSIASGLVDGWFFDQDTGFVIGSYGSPLRRALILSTVDGGDTWQVRHQGQRDDEILWKVFFPSRMVGYASVQSDIDHVGPSPDSIWVLKTTDGGLTWNEKSVRTFGFFKLQGIGFINDQVGWVGGDCCQATIFKTTDGGDTWAPTTGFGVQTPPYNTFHGFTLNRFRKFGDTLMYAAGNTVYKMDTTATVGLDASPVGAEVMLYPNPANEGIGLRFKTLADAGECTWVLYDAQGRMACAPMMTVGATGDLPGLGLAAGLYVYRCTSGGRILGSGRLLVTD
ncbi:MAG: T9SS type A sorting domain-containing protein [Bacteroidia bacterium]